jgi:uncharacterized membrane protein
LLPEITGPERAWGRALCASRLTPPVTGNSRWPLTLRDASSEPSARKHRIGFFDDFRRFFVRGLAAVLPTLITLWLLVWAWNFLWEALGQYIVWGIRWTWFTLGGWWIIPREPAGHIHEVWNEQFLGIRIVGVGLAVLLVYIVGVFVGNFIGRQLWRVAELAVMRVPLVRAIYPSVKQVTDWLLSEHTSQFKQTRVVAVQPHAKGIWSVGLLTGAGLGPLQETVGQEMVTVFVPSSPTAFSGYVLVVPRESVVELPFTVEEAMRLLISGGVISPQLKSFDEGSKEVPAPLEGSEPAVGGSDDRSTRVAG